MSSDVVWRLEGESALLTCGPLTGRLELNAVGSGWMDLAWNGKSCDPFEVLCANVAKDARVVESYVRGADLVVNYSQSPGSAVAPHFYWRADFASEVEAARIEMVVSVQTNLLDSRPGALVRSFSRGARLFHACRLESQALVEVSENHLFSPAESQTHLVILRHEPLGVSYAELVHPSDLESLQLLLFQHDGRTSTMSMLFQKPQLEKGVIRRARICGWFLPTENDLAVAVELAKQFVDEPVPLTT
jgi:hypothetical protein